MDRLSDRSSTLLASTNELSLKDFGGKKSIPMR